MFYDSWKKKKRTRAGSKLVSILHKKLALKTLALTGTEKNLLEIGPGTGGYIEEASRLGLKCSIAEPNKLLAQACLQKAPKIKIIPHAVPPIKSPSSVFDIVYMGHVIEHFSDHKEVIQVMNEIHRVLKKKGILLLFYPDYLYFGKDFFDIDYTHSYITTPNRIKYILADTCFKIVKTETFNACFSGPYRILLSPLFRIFSLSMGFCYWLTKMEIFLKAKITFGRNILVTAIPLENH